MDFMNFKTRLIVHTHLYINSFFVFLHISRTFYAYISMSTSVRKFLRFECTQFRVPIVRLCVHNIILYLHSQINDSYVRFFINIYTNFRSAKHDDDHRIICSSHAYYCISQSPLNF